MLIDILPGEQHLLLIYCSFTCIYLPGILLLLKFTNSLYDVGTYKFIPILFALIFAELVKVWFSLLQTNEVTLKKTETRANPKSKKLCTKTLKTGFKFLVSTSLLSAIYYVVIVLFGAPILSHHEETIMLTLTLTTLTFVPACLHLGIDTALALLFGMQVGNGNLFAEAVKTNVKFTLLGTWLGAIAIPLDWDRPWQAWPVPCVTSALFGYILAHVVTLISMLPIMKQDKSKSHR
ncbi:phosphatidylinositol-glycan biosynthesis class F protein [Belonocnema kinseyi]|uniref:phosphatidylinositol-glycan biosynthesis class F protein n=1 Tax=Belonocnema kinseyi TaxID=2817044 RepID=UPI00143DEF22|nr:phosphatidylinositol-glycan biosynthesis class F protein [Belonocnema kinseyi]